jgi:hypothetical protein
MNLKARLPAQLKTDPRFSYSVYQTGDVYNNGASTLTDADQNGNSSVVNGVTKKISWRKFMIIYQESASVLQAFIPAVTTSVLYAIRRVLLEPCRMCQ